MEKNPSSGHDLESFVLVVSIFGAVVGTGAGGAVAAETQSTRLAAIVSAFLAVALITCFRLLLGKWVPALLLPRPGTKMPNFLWLSIFLSTLIGGLAGHDLCQLFDVTAGPVIGFASGTLAAVSMASLMVLYFTEHPERKLDF